MKSYKTALAIGALTVGVSVASADDHMLGEFHFGGYIDAYYQYDFNKPGAGDTISGRLLDRANKTITLATAELEVTRAATKAIPFSFTGNFGIGRNNDLTNLMEPGGHLRYKWIRQLYASYAFPGNGGLSVDFGKFNSWIGAESVDNRTNDNYSRSFAWTIGQPNYATGIRVNAKVNDKASVSLYGVKGWNEVADKKPHDNAYGMQIRYGLNSRADLTLNGYFGKDGSDNVNDFGAFGGIGFPAPGSADIQLFDLVLKYKWDDKTTLTFDGYTGRTSSSDFNDGEWNGQAVYIHRQLSENRAFALRFDRFEDKDGLRAGLPVKLYSLTGTYDWGVAKNLTLRGELRHDMSNLRVFGSDSTPKKDRTTFTIGAILKF